MNALAPAVAKARLANSLSGTTGSAARRSRTTKPPIAATAVTASARIVGEPHAYCVPPQELTRTVDAAPTVSSSAPRTSTGRRSRRGLAGSLAAITLSAAAPTGRFT